MKILDCTLRDGGYYTNWDFDNKMVEVYLKSINQLPIDYVEVGYRSSSQEIYMGKYFYLPNFVFDNITHLAPNAKLAIMLNEKDTKLESLKKLLSGLKPHITLIRIAVNPENLEKAIVLGKEIKKNGFKVAFNIMYISKFYNNLVFIKKLNPLNEFVSYLYLVDSYGSMTPKEIKTLMLNVKNNYNGNIGFHGHNNMELAFANALAAIEGGCNIIDSTVLGMGRGAGNLKTELILTYLAAKEELNFDFNILANLVENWLPLLKKHEWGTNLPYMVSGATSLPQKDVMEWVGKRFYSYNTIIRALENQSKGLKDNIVLKKFLPDYKAKKVFIIGGGPSGSEHSNAVKELLKKESEIVLIHVSSKNVGAYENVSNKQIHCLVGNEGHRLENIFEKMTLSNRIAILPPFPRTMGSYIPTFFNKKAFQLKEISFINISKESTTAIAVQTAIDLKAQELFFIGYDGYKDFISENELELFNENQLIFEKLNYLQIAFCSLTPTKYSNLPEKSIYSLL